MTRGGRVELKLEVDPGGDPIRGEVADPLGRTHEFHGWVQLVAAIERARPSEREEAGSDGSPAREAGE